MSAIAAILFFLFLLLFGASVVALIRPSWMNIKTRKEAVPVTVFCLLVFLALTPFLPDTEPEQSEHTTESALEKMKREALAEYGTATPQERRKRKAMELYFDTFTRSIASCLDQQEAAYLVQHPHADKLPNDMGQQIFSYCLDRIKQATKTK